MGVFTLDASNINGIAHKFACSRPMWIGPMDSWHLSRDGVLADCSDSEETWTADSPHSAQAQLYEAAPCPAMPTPSTRSSTVSAGVWGLTPENRRRVVRQPGAGHET